MSQIERPRVSAGTPLAARTCSARPDSHHRCSSPNRDGREIRDETRSGYSAGRMGVGPTVAVGHRMGRLAPQFLKAPRPSDPTSAVVPHRIPSLAAIREHLKSRTSRAGRSLILGYLGAMISCRDARRDICHLASVTRYFCLSAGSYWEIERWGGEGGPIGHMGREGECDDHVDPCPLGWGDRSTQGTRSDDSADRTPGLTRHAGRRHSTARLSRGLLEIAVELRQSIAYEVHGKGGGWLG